MPDPAVRSELADRRTRLAALPGLGARADVQSLLREVDAAIGRLDANVFGLCEHCDDSIERERILADPLTRVCLGCLSDDQARALERDLELAAVVQGALLPSESVRAQGWEIEYRYRPLGPVSGDHCDVLPSGAPDAPLHFILGDVSGKGVSASILMSHLQATFRALVSLGMPLAGLAERANRIFCESTVSNSYATMLVGRLFPSGMLEIANAGHCPPLLVRGGDLTSVPATGMPLGLFCGSTFDVTRFELARGDALFLYTDGLSEASNANGEQYGGDRVEAFARRLNGGTTGAALQRCLDDVDAFRRGAPAEDDLTVMMIRRSG